MSQGILPEHVWERVKALLPDHIPSRKGGRPPLDHRATLSGILVVLRTGMRWQHLRTDMGYGSGMTCWRRLRAWQRDGTWQRVEEVLRVHLPAANSIDWSRTQSAAERRASSRKPPLRNAGGE
jgi:transposase